MQAKPWLAFHKPNPAARVRLFCFPYAGGGASAYRTWSESLPTTVEVCPVQLPGREERWAEPRFTRMLDLVGAVIPALMPVLDKPFCLFGHSLGALTVFVLTRELRCAGLPLPRHLFLSGRTAPRGASQKRLLHRLSDAQLVEELRRLNGTPGQVLENAELMQLLLPILRSDLQMSETYTWTPEPPLAIPVTAFAGTEDPAVPEEGVAAWEQETSQTFRMHRIRGGHFFLHTAASEMLTLLRQELEAVVSQI
jgi:medium-chain acyl-[acyl-carrier-protein] hydrolase